MIDPVPRAKRLLSKLRTLKHSDATIKVEPMDVELLERGLCALIDCYAAGREHREWIARAQKWAKTG